MGSWRRFAHRHVVLSASWTLLIRLTTFIGLSCGLWLGLTNHIFPVPTFKLLKFEVDADAALLLLGIINKVADYFVEFALTDVAERCLASWMMWTAVNGNVGDGAEGTNWKAATITAGGIGSAGSSAGGNRAGVAPSVITDDTAPNPAPSNTAPPILITLPSPSIASSATTFLLPTLGPAGSSVAGSSGCSGGANNNGTGNSDGTSSSSSAASITSVPPSNVSASNVTNASSTTTLTLPSPSLHSPSSPSSASSNFIGGVYYHDFDMAEELTRPWLAVGALYTRIRHKRWLRGKRPGFGDAFRFLLSLAASVCFLLLGAGINTVALPKTRWYPSDFGPEQSMLQPSMVTPRMTIDSINHGNYWGKAGQQVGEVDGVTANLSRSLIAQDTFKGLDGLFFVYNGDLPPRGLASVANYDCMQSYPDLFNLPSMTAINSTVTNLHDGPGEDGDGDGNASFAAVNSTSLYGPSLNQIYEQLNSDGPHFAQVATGIMGTLYTVQPMLTTTCVTGMALDPSDQSGSMIVRYPPKDGASQANLSDIASRTMRIQLPAARDLGSPGFTCNLTLRQVVYPIGWGFRQDEKWWWIDGGFQDNRNISSIMPVTQADAIIMSAIGEIVHDIAPWLDRISGSASFGRHALLTGRHLQDRNRKITLVNDVTATTAVVATIVQNIMTMGVWNVTLETPSSSMSTPFSFLSDAAIGNGKIINSTGSPVMLTHPVRFYLYGAGPRRPWQRIAHTILFILAAAVLLDIVWIVADPRPPPHVLEPAGMMLVANSSQVMGSAERSDGRGGELAPADDRSRYWAVEDASRADTSTGKKQALQRLEITDDLSGWRGLRRRKVWWDEQVEK